MGLAAGAVAMTLGQGRGAAQLGAPLDLVFDVGLGPNTNLGAACLNAQVTFGETRVNASKTKLTPLSELGPTGMPQVRLQGPVVQEPVVRVALTGGCVNKVSRQYTFLTELPQVAASAASVASADLPKGGTPVVAAPAPAGQEPATVVASPTVPAATTASPAVRPAGGNTAAKPAAPSPLAAKAGPAQPVPSRLQMEVLDTRPVSTTGLRSSWMLAAPPIEQASPRRAEAAAMWRQLNQGGQELQQAFDRAGALEAEAGRLRIETQQARAQAQEAQTQLAASLQERYPAEWVYGLAGTSITFLGVAIWGWRRSRKVQLAMEPAWHQAPVDEASATGESAPTATGSAGLPEGRSSAAWPLQPVTAEPTLAAPLPRETPLQAQLPQGAVQDERIDQTLAVSSVAEPVAAPAPAPSAQALLLDDGGLSDWREQAEFYASVGEHEQAIQLLKAHIASNAHRSPAAYLDLLQLYHTLGRAEDFRQLRSELMRHFKAEVPGFSVFSLPSKDLEAYPDILQQIQGAWPTAAVAPLLQALIYRSTDAATGQENYELAAFDDLQLLLGLVQQTTAEDRSGGAVKPEVAVPPVHGPDALSASAAMAAGSTPVAANAAQRVDMVDAQPRVAIDFALHPPLELALPEPPAAPAESVPAVPPAVSPKWRAPVRPMNKAVAMDDAFPMEAVLLPPDDFLKIELPFTAPPRQAPEPSQPSALTERLRMGGDIDFDRPPQLNDLLISPLPEQPPKAEPHSPALPTTTPEDPLLADEPGSHRFVGKARDFEWDHDKSSSQK